VADIISFLRNYDYDICLMKGRWTLEEAVDYLAAFAVSKAGWTDRESAYRGFVAVREKIAAEMRDSIDEGRLVVDEEFLEGSKGNDMGAEHLDFRKSAILPLFAINWAVEKGIEVPPQFQLYAAKHRHSKTSFYQGLGVKKSCIHHERSRAVAQLLWSFEPDLPISEMARRREIMEIGCEGQPYDTRTICRWLSTLKSDRKPGRRKGKASS
jgi:hypothetical protein